MKPTHRVDQRHEQAFNQWFLDEFGDANGKKASRYASRRSALRSYFVRGVFHSWGIGKPFKAHTDITIPEIIRPVFAKAFAAGERAGDEHPYSNEEAPTDERADGSNGTDDDGAFGVGD